MRSNAELAELLARAAETQADRKQRALRRAARHALTWPVEAADVVRSDRPLTDLRSVGPYVASVLDGLLVTDPVEPDPIRRGFITLAHARRVLAEHPDVRPRADLQMHTTYSDGTVSVAEMASACAARGYDWCAVTDHSKGLAIANGMSEERLAAQSAEIAALNAKSAGVHVVHGIEMNLSPAGASDMDEDALAPLGLVLGAFHSRLRVAEDQTDRYLAAVRNPAIDVLAHPRGRIFNFRMGLHAEWERVFEVAAGEGVALEIDCTPDRQDLDVELARAAAAWDVRFSIGSDAHHPDELRFLEIGVATAILAGIGSERILNFAEPSEIRRETRAKTRPKSG